MAFSRATTALQLPQGDGLTSAMIGIGMAFAGRAAAAPNIEDTLVAASMEGVERDDLRTLSVLVTWIGIHHSWINADRLIRAVKAQKSSRLRAFWAAIARWLHGDRRFARLAVLRPKHRGDLLRVGSDFQVSRRGEDPRFDGGPMRVPAGVLRDRPADVLAPAELARRHRAYRCRVLMGPSYRADMWAALEAEPSLSAAELARRTYGSFATAWHVKNASRVLHAR